MREEGGLLIPSWMTKNPIKISVRFFGFADKDDKSFFWQRDKIMKTLNTSYVSKYFSSVSDKFTESLDKKRILNQCVLQRMEKHAKLWW